MSGILDWLQSAVGKTGTAGQDNGTGILGWMAGTPQSLQGPWSGSPMASRLGLIGAGLQDMQGAIDGGDSGRLAGTINGMKALNEQAAINQEVSAAFKTGGINAARKVLLNHAMAGHDVSHITGPMSSMSAIQPKVQDIGGTGYSIDPLGGDPRMVIPGSKPPAMRTIQQGDQNVDQEWDPITRAFKTVGKGQKFKASAVNPAMAAPRSGPF